MVPVRRDAAPPGHPAPVHRAARHRPVAPRARPHAAPLVRRRPGPRGPRRAGSRSSRCPRTGSRSAARSASPATPPPAGSTPSTSWSARARGAGGAGLRGRARAGGDDRVRVPPAAPGGLAAQSRFAAHVVTDDVEHAGVRPAPVRVRPTRRSLRRAVRTRRLPALRLRRPARRPAAYLDALAGTCRSHRGRRSATTCSDAASTRRSPAGCSACGGSLNHFERRPLNQDPVVAVAPFSRGPLWWLAAHAPGRPKPVIDAERASELRERYRASNTRLAERHGLRLVADR